MNTIFALPAGITTIIAHRLSTVERRDTLLWNEDGRLRAAGMPAELPPASKTSLEEAAPRKAAQEAEAHSAGAGGSPEMEAAGAAAPDAPAVQGAPESAETGTQEDPCSPSSSSR